MQFDKEEEIQELQKEIVDKKTKLEELLGRRLVYTKKGNIDMKTERNYNQEFRDTDDHKYSYNFDFDVMHHYMLRSFIPFFKEGNFLELGSYKGDFTKKFLPYFHDITCVEASDEAVKIAKETIPSNIVTISKNTFSDTSNNFYNTYKMPIIIVSVIIILPIPSSNVSVSLCIFFG